VNQLDFSVSGSSSSAAHNRCEVFESQLGCVGYGVAALKSFLKFRAIRVSCGRVCSRLANTRNDVATPQGRVVCPDSSDCLCSNYRTASRVT
jgi:hypothetical protein